MKEGISISLMRVPALIKRFLASVTAQDARNTLYAGTTEVAYTPTFTGFGTVTNVNFTWTRVGSRIKVMGKFTAGTTTASEAKISLPGSLVSDAALIPSIELCGVLITNATADATIFGFYCLIESGVGHITMSRQRSTVTAFTKIQGNQVCSSGDNVSVQFEFPVDGWNG
jgi:hypothetical protein